MLNLIVCGSTGKYGQKVLELARASTEFRVVGEVHRGASLENCAVHGAVVVDFSTPEASAHHATMCAQSGMAAVIATTGFNGDQMAAIQAAAKKVPLVVTPNTSLGVNMILSWMQTAAECLGPDYKIDISETHHTRKKDAPSGTALRLAKALAGKEVPITSVREGEIVGIHRITFTGPYEKIVVTHEALNSKLFAEGALIAARWVTGKPAGLYDMQDVLGLKHP
jgi:4-hydroxy-tetrahydrodipicolinate reductase